mgnify:FL=1
MAIEISAVHRKPFDSKNSNTAWRKPFLKIGHGGASGHAPANSLASLRTALDMGVDMVEFDVRPCRDALVLVHDERLNIPNAPERLVSQCSLAELRALALNPEFRIATLPEALDLLMGRALINIDLKAAGYEIEVHELVHARGLAAEVLYSSVIPSSLLRIAQAAPEVKIGLSYPEDRSGASSKPYLKPVVNTFLAAMRLTLPYRILSMMAKAQASAVMLYHKIVSPRVVQVVQRAEGRVFTWTVDDPRAMSKLRAMGVNGITTNYPDLFDTSPGL